VARPIKRGCADRRHPDAAKSDGANVEIRPPGPFTETKELVAGFWLWQVKSMEEAIEWVKRCPNPMQSDSDIEIRQVFEAEDFGAEFTPALRAQEDRLREEIEGEAKKAR
jgi:YCII-related domain